MEAAEAWRTLFETWPEAIPRQGMLVTSFKETVPFTGFLFSPGILLVERDAPDSLGARKMMISFDEISAVKIANPMELGRFQVMGFQPPM